MKVVLLSIYNIDFAVCHSYMSNTFYEPLLRLFIGGLERTSKLSSLFLIEHFASVNKDSLFEYNNAFLSSLGVFLCRPEVRNKSGYNQIFLN